MYSYARPTIVSLVFAAVISFLGSTPALSAASGALFFDGNSWIEVPDRSNEGNTSLDITGPLTMEAWISFTTYPNCCWNTVMAKLFGTSGANGSYSIQFSNHPSDPVSSDTLWALFVSDVSGSEGAVKNIDALPVRDGSWHHIAAVYDIQAGKTLVYINGVLAGENNKTASIQISESAFTIGNQLGADRRTFQGYIDEVRLWNVARTPDQIRDHMNREICAGEPGLAGYWNFNEGAGTTANDTSGNENHGTFVNSPIWVESRPDLTPCQTAPVVETVQISGPWRGNALGGLEPFDLDGDGQNDEGAVIGVAEVAQHYAYAIDITNQGAAADADGFAFLDSWPNEFLLDPEGEAFADSGLVSGACSDGNCDGAISDPACLATFSGPTKKGEETIRSVLIQPLGLGSNSTCRTVLFLVTAPTNKKGDDARQPVDCEVFEGVDATSIVDTFRMNEGVKTFEEGSSELRGGPIGSIQLTPVRCP